MKSNAQIIATIGPASMDIPILSLMLKEGMDIARINFSHGTHASNGEAMRNIRAAALLVGKRVPIIADLAGPRERTEGGHGFDDAKSIITEKDLADVEFCLKEGVDYFAQSFVGSAADIAVLRAALSERGASTPIIAKIERAEAVSNFDAILESADGIMIARGDLGNAIPVEDIPFVEKACIAQARLGKKPVIVATQMMYTMTKNAEPTRAEVTDVAYAILSGADAIMLSEESAIGEHPVEVVRYMERIASRAEREESHAVQNF